MVSDNMTSIAQLCNDTIWIESGHLRERGPTKVVVSRYLTSGSRVDGLATWENGTANPGVDAFRLLSICIRNDARQVATVLDVEKEFFLELEYKVAKTLPHCRVGFTLTNVEGIHAGCSYVRARMGLIRPNLKWEKEVHVPLNADLPTGKFITHTIEMPAT
jgi:hypothetical protein